MSNEPCRLCGSEPTIATYYDFYRFHCPTPGCREHLSAGTIYSGKGSWYGSIAEARDAWNHRQRRGEATSAPQSAEPEHEPAGVGNEPQDGAECVDTREKLEADVLAYLTPYEIDARLLGETIIGWLNRQAAITEQEVRARERYGEKANYYGALAEDLACKLDILKDHGVEIVDAVGGGYEVYNQEKKRADELTVERDELKTRVAELESELKCYEGVDEAKEMWAKACQRERDKNAAMYAERDEAYKRGYDDGLHANTKAAFAAAKQAFGDESSVRFEGGIIKSQAQRIRELEAELDACKLREEAAKDYDFREAAERWEKAFEDKCAEAARLTAECDYWKSQMRKCLEHATESYVPEVMEFPRDEHRACEPSLLVIDKIDNLQDFLADACGDVATLREERDRLRMQCKADLEVMSAQGESVNELEDTVAVLDAEIERMKEVARTQADSFAKLERELADADRSWKLEVEALQNELDESESTANTLRASVAGLKETVERQSEVIAAQRDELARFNREKHGKRRLPKGIAWPRHDDGKLVKLNAVDACSIAFTRGGCLVRFADGGDEYFPMDELRRRWKERG